MNTRNGDIHPIFPHENMEQLAHALGLMVEEMVPVKHAPSSDCKKCDGTGKRRAGVNSTRFKPCECTET